MAYRRISQREAQRLRKRVRELETARRALVNSYISPFPGVFLGVIEGVAPTAVTTISTAQRLKTPCVVRVEDGKIWIYGLKGGTSS